MITPSITNSSGLYQSKFNLQEIIFRKQRCKKEVCPTISNKNLIFFILRFIVSTDTDIRKY